jgi:integrase
MPWRKYTPKKGKHGPIYHICKGIQIRCGYKKIWTLFIEKGGVRTNRTIGSGRQGLAKAVKAAEAIAVKIGSICPTQIANGPKAKGFAFKAYSRDWLENNAKRWDVLTYERYEAILRLHIWPYACFNKTVTDVSRKDIKDHLRKIFKKRSPATVEAVHSVLSGIFEEAIDDGKLGVNPTTGLLKKILPPKRQRDLKDPDPFTRDERDLFLAQAESTCSLREQLILKVMVHAGLRLGEALAMRLKNLNIEKKSYLVAESFKLKRFKKPKQDKTRFVDFPDFLVDEIGEFVTHLKKEGLKQGRGSHVDLLFIDPKEYGEWPYSQRKIQALFKRVCKAVGLRIRNPHDLRHTYATIMLMAHQSPGYVQKQLGHSSISTTMDIYCHWISGEGREGLEKALMGTKKTQKNLYENRIKSHKFKKRPQ